MGRSIAILPVIIGLSCLASSSPAEDLGNRWGVSGLVQAGVPLDADSIRRQGGLGTDMGGMLSYGLSSHTGVGLSYENIDLPHGVRAQPIILSGIYSFMPGKNWTPYVRLGGGIAAGNSESFSNMAAKAALGMEYFFTHHVALGPEVNYTYVYEVGDAPKQAHALGAGLIASYFFGGKSVPRVATAPKPVVLVLRDAHFISDPSALSNEAKALLDEDVQLLRKYPKTDIWMTGYIFAVGTEEYNRGLSERRADAVRAYLIKKGIAPKRLTIIGYGRARPVAHGAASGDIHSIAARSDKRALFEIVVR